MNELTTSILGYNKRQVDAELQSNNSKIKELEDNVSQLEAKMAELEEQLSYYQALESTLKEGIMDARSKGNEIIELSEVKADEILKQTNEQVVQYKEDLANHSQDLIDSGLVLKNSFNSMKREFANIIHRYDNLLKDTDFDILYPSNHVARLSMQLQELSEDKLSLNKEDHQNSVVDNSLSDEEKVELEKLIQEVISNESHHDAKISEKNLINLRTAKR